MQRDRMFELRVLTGTHAGARAVLGEEAQLLGSGEDCDLILSDEGVLARHARLERQEDGSTVLRWLDGELPPLVIRPGEGAVLGPVHIAIEHADAPWRADIPLHQPPAQDATGKDQEIPAGAVLQEASGDAAGSSATAKASRRLRLAWGLGALCVLMAVAVLAWWGWQATRAPLPPAPAAAKKPDIEERLAALRAAIEPLGLGPRVQLRAAPGQPVRVQASLLSDEEVERLAGVLLRLSPRPRLELRALDEVEAKLRDLLGRHARDGTAPPLSAKYLGDARFRIAGRVRDEAARERLLSELRTQVPEIGEFDSALQTDAEAADGMLQDLRQSGVQRVEGQWVEGVLALRVTLARSEIPRWERALASVAPRHPLRFRATLDLVEQALPPPVRLPFSVRSVTSSDPPYVMLGDGRKLVPGATVDGWQLLAVQPRAVVFEDAGGRQLSLER